MGTLQVVTCLGKIPDPVTEPYYFYPQFLALLARFGVVPDTLTGVWTGLGSNAKWVLRALNSGRINSDHMIFTNSFDVLFRVPPQEILDSFLDLQHHNGNLPSILFGAEKHCFSDASLAPLHPETPYSYKYLNSGWYIGETQSVFDALKEMDPENTLVDDHIKEDGSWHHDNDQNSWMLQMLKGNVPIWLDSEAQFVWTMHDVAEGEVDWKDTVPRCIETGNTPFVYHLNGNGKNVYKDRLIASLGL